MTSAPAEPIRLKEGRFARLEAIEWWDPSLIRNARILVVGAGALGNEIIKNFALLGVGHVAVVDMDRVELSNLCRSVLFRESDEGSPKAECAARAATGIYPEMDIRPIVGNVMADVGLGWFRWAQVVVAALDNREARVFVNSSCARVGRPWIDGGIDVLSGIVRGFHPPSTACYECTMSEVDWQLLNKRRSCSLLARRAIENRGTPTTPTTASIVGAIQAQEAIKLLHGMDPLLGRGFVFEGAGHNSYAVSYSVNPDCGWHDAPGEVVALPDFRSDTLLRKIWEEAGRRLGGLDALDLVRELVERMDCPACGTGEPVFRSLEKVHEDEALCPGCGKERVPRFIHSITEGSQLLGRSAQQVGLPSWDIVMARRGERVLAFELAGDNPYEKTVETTR